MKKEIAKLQIDFKKLSMSERAKNAMEGALPSDAYNELKKKLDDKEAEAKRASNAGKPSFSNATNNALKRHALLKYLNTKYSGRVATVDMCFNPYIMCGFPGAVIADDEAQGGQAMKTIIGMVQQVKHLIIISPDSGEASTSVVLSNARFIDEPTDMDQFGNPLYMKPTNAMEAEIDPKTYEHVQKYYIGEPNPVTMKQLNNQYYDLDDTQPTQDYVYVKDLLTLTKKDVEGGERNQIYIDNDYEPNKISKFYKRVFKHREEHFMIGQSTDPTGITPRKFPFTFDSIHEGLNDLKHMRPELLIDYEKCI
jgi:hypothetical protein